MPLLYELLYRKDNNMKKVGFIGVYDKTDLILDISKLLTRNGKKVLFIDSTKDQKAKYIVPNILPTVSYVTTFEDIDVAIGFENIEQIAHYLGVDTENEFEYEYIFLDTDNFDGVRDFEALSFDKLYYVTSFDGYSLRKGIELLKEINLPLKMTRLFFTKEMLKEEDEYFNYLTLELKEEWTDKKLYFLLENGDLAVHMENHRLQCIKLKNLSNEYRENIVYIVRELCSGLDEKMLRKMTKEI